MYTMTDEEFEGAVADAIDSIPEHLAAELDNVAFFVEDEPTPEQLGSDGLFADSGDLLGLYEGVSLFDRAEGYGFFGDMPDAITIFKGPHERLEGGREEILEEVRRTVIHEVGHFFGMDEDQIERMGYA